MNTKGIYTLANDVVYDQLVALLNSIEQNVSGDIPICVIPFDDRLEKVKREIDARPQVSLFTDETAITKWENFAQEVWQAYPKFKQKPVGRPCWSKNHHRKFASFDGPFTEFVFYDGDSLAMKPLDNLFAKLNNYDFVFDDWEYSKPVENAALDIPLISKTGLYTAPDVSSKIHCSSFFASKQGILNDQKLNKLKQLLIEQGEVSWLNGWDDAFLFSYLTLRLEHPIYNFTQSLDNQERTGNCADADPFINIDNVLYNEQGLKPIHRLHYMNYPAADFASLTQGKDVDIRYKEVFLHYRFLKQPELRPSKLKSSGFWNKINRNLSKNLKKSKAALFRTFAQLLPKKNA